ncbi:uncharacterized protein BKA78DRAFT_356184 [Phyllosticta capitalensis]|uniref:uncharacterized protein n=1 Tax=Phyllosticta capitalensis TaxID=121624 RepID=UPI00312D021B
MAAPQQQQQYEIREAKAIPAHNFNHAPNVVRMCDVPKGISLYQQHTLVCGYLHIPNTHVLMNIISSLEDFVLRFIDAENRSWYPAGDQRAQGKPAHWLQIRLMSVFFPTPENGNHIVRHFDVIRRRVGLDRDPTLADLAGTVFSEHDLPVIGQAIACVQLMSRVPHLFHDSINIGPGAAGLPVFNAEDVNRASCLLRCARKQLGKHMHLQQALPIHYAYPPAANNNAAPGNNQAAAATPVPVLAPAFQTPPVRAPMQNPHVNNFVTRRAHEALQNSYRELQVQHAAAGQRIAQLEAALRDAHEREEVLRAASILMNFGNGQEDHDAMEM